MSDHQTQWPPPRVVFGDGPEQRWWTAFGSPQLDALVDQAIAHNRSLAASNATLAAERALTEGAAVLDVEIARGGVLYL